MGWNSGYEQSSASVCFLQQTQPKDVSHYFPLYKTLRRSLKKKKEEFSPSYKFQKENLHHIPRDNDDIEFASKSVLPTGVRCTPFVARVQLPPSPKSNDQKERKKEKGEAKTSREGRRSSDRRPKFHHRRIPGGAVFVIRVRIAIPIDARSWLHTG